VTADPLFFRDLSFVLLAAVLGGFAARAARQPLIVGFVLGGMLIGPFTPGPSVSDLHTFELFAEIGVVLLMFSIGIEFSLKDLLRVKWVALIGGPLGMLLTVALGLGVGTALGWPLLQGAVVGIVISVASTMVLVQLLMDRGNALHALARAEDCEHRARERNDDHGGDADVESELYEGEAFPIHRSGEHHPEPARRCRHRRRRLSIGRSAYPLHASRMRWGRLRFPRMPFHSCRPAPPIPRPRVPPSSRPRGV